MAGNKRMGKRDVKSRLETNMPTVRSFGICRIGLFGSLVRGEAVKGSDIDILVEFKKGQEKFDNLMGLYFYLKELLGGEIDLVTTGGLSPYLAKSILDEVEYIEAISFYAGETGMSINA